MGQDPAVLHDEVLNNLSVARETVIELFFKSNMRSHATVLQTASTLTFVIYFLTNPGVLTRLSFGLSFGSCWADATSYVMISDR
jgi:hypothetical protein